MIKEKMKKQIITLTAIVAILVAAIFAGCVEKDAPVATPTSITMPPPTSTLTPLPTLTPSPTFRNDDDAFLDFPIGLGIGIGEAIHEIVEALNEENYPKAEKLSGDLETLTEKYMEELEDYQVSQEVLPIKIKMKESLFEYNLASKIFKNGTRNQDPYEIAEVEEPWDNGFNLLTEVIDDIIALKESELAELNGAPKTWHRVTSFSGSTDKTTPPFTIKGDEWRVKWSIKGDPDYTYFSVYAYPRGQTRGSVSNWNCDKSPCSDTQYIYEGTGDYYFKIGAANLDSWKLEVEDYY